jgi:hypothetical protein
MRHSRLVFCVCFGSVSLACGNSASDSAPAGGAAVESATSGGASGNTAANAVVSGGTAPSVVTEAEAGEGGSDTPTIAVSADGEVTSIVTSPLALTPSFSTSIHDYYVRCVAGDNALTVTTADANGMNAQDLNLIPDQAVTVDDQYWIRCLPPDFPVITVKQPGTPTPGYYLVNSATYGVVFDTDGVPVWYARGSAVLNLDSPAPNTLSFMPNYAPDVGNDSTAPFQIRSLTSNLVTSVASPSGQTDVHEFRSLANGDYLLFTAPMTTGVDLTGLQSYGTNETMLDCEVEELSPSGALVWSWLASDHVDPVRESLEPAGTTAGTTAVVDVFHCNSIEVDASGNLLISMRHANAVFYIDRSSGQIQWKLGGSAYNKDGASLITVQGDAETTFTMQHDARFQSNGNVSLFDDHGAGTGVARGMEYAIDHDTGVATPVFQFLGTAASSYEGSFRRYADGESVIGWGYVPTDPRILTEIDATGRDVFDIAFSAGNVSYRAVKVPLSQLDIDLMRRATGK